MPGQLMAGPPQDIRRLVEGRCGVNNLGDTVHTRSVALRGHPHYLVSLEPPHRAGVDESSAPVCPTGHVGEGHATLGEAPAVAVARDFDDGANAATELRPRPLAWPAALVAFDADDIADL